MPNRQARADHLAFPTADIEATITFYDKVMEWPLVKAWGDADVAEPYFIVAFDAGGVLLEFEAQPTNPAPAPISAAAFPHIGLDVGGRTELRRWRDHLHDNDVPLLELHDGRSLYLKDPNGLVIQLFHGNDDAPPQTRAELDDAVQAWNIARRHNPADHPRPERLDQPI